MEPHRILFDSSNPTLPSSYPFSIWKASSSSSRSVSVCPFLLYSMYVHLYIHTYTCTYAYAYSPWNILPGLLFNSWFPSKFLSLWSVSTSSTSWLLPLLQSDVLQSINVLLLKMCFPMLPVMASASSHSWLFCVLVGTSPAQAPTSLPDNPPFVVFHIHYPFIF